MKQNKIKLLIILSVWLIIMMAAPASAGRITVRNLHSVNACYVVYDSWYFGFNVPSNLCANAGETVMRDYWYSSIGKIMAFLTVRGCNEGGGTIKKKEYFPVGALWPWRTFTVTIQSTGAIDISEP